MGNSIGDSAERELRKLVRHDRAQVRGRVEAFDPSRSIAQPDLIGKVTGSGHSKGTTQTVDIYSGAKGSETTLRSVSAYNRFCDFASGDWVFVTWINGGYEIWPCTKTLDIFSKKYDTDGNFVWESTVAGPMREANGYCVGTSSDSQSGFWQWVNVSTGAATSDKFRVVDDVPLVTSLGSDGLFVPLSDGRLFVSLDNESAAETNRLPGFTDNTTDTATIPAAPCVAGYFRIGVGGQVTSNIAYNATAATIKSAIEALSTVTTATVTGGPLNTDPIDITLDSYSVGGFTQFTATGSGNRLKRSQFAILDPSDQSLVTLSLSGSGATFLDLHSIGSDKIAARSLVGTYALCVMDVDTGANTVSADWHVAELSGDRIPFWHDSDPSSFGRFVAIFASPNSDYVHAVYHPTSFDGGVTTDNVDSYNKTTGALVTRGNSEQQTEKAGTIATYVAGDTNSIVQAKSHVNRWHYDGAAPWIHSGASNTIQGYFGGKETAVIGSGLAFVTGGTLATYTDSKAIYTGTPAGLATFDHFTFGASLTADFDPVVGETHTWVTIPTTRAVPITGGTFVIETPAGDTAAIPYQFNRTDVKTAIEALAGYGSGTVNVHGVKTAQQPAKQILPAANANYLYECLAFYIDDSVSAGNRHGSWSIDVSDLEVCGTAAIMAFNESGECQWKRRFGLTTAGEVAPSAVVVGDSGNLYATSINALARETFNADSASCDCVSDCEFDGVDDFADYGSYVIEFADPPDDAFTLTLRARWDRVTGTQCLLSQDLDQATDGDLTLYSDGTTLHFIAKGPDDYPNIDLTATIAVDTVYLIEISKDGDEWTLKLDGVTQDTFTDDDDGRESSDVSLMIGARSDSSSTYNATPIVEHFAGLICDIKYDGTVVPFTITR